MTATIDLPNGHLDFLKALSRPTDYQKLLIELYEKTDIRQGWWLHFLEFPASIRTAST